MEEMERRDGNDSIEMVKRKIVEVPSKFKSRKDVGLIWSG